MSQDHQAPNYAQPTGEKWYQGLGPQLRPLALQSLQLLEREKKSPGTFSDYQFIVFPFAKAYEVYLKDLLFQAQIIDQRTYNNKYFSIGRALNPDVRLEQRDQNWYYDDLIELTDEKVARYLWDTWLERNRLIHLYPGEEKALTLEEAEAQINHFIRAIDLSFYALREREK